MLNSDQIKAWLRKFEGIRPFIDAAGGAWTFLAFVGGAALVTLLIGFLKENPAIAMACAMIVAYFGFLLFERVTIWLRRDTLDHKLSFANGVPLVRSQGDTCDVIYQFAIKNHADYDIYFLMDDEEFSLGTDKAEPLITKAVQIIPAGQTTGQMSGRIKAKFPIRSRSVLAKFTVRFGRSNDKLEMRWFLEAETFIPGDYTESKETAPPGSLIRRNAFERLAL